MGTLRYKVVKRRNPMTAAVSYGPRLLRYTLIKADDVVERAAQNSNIDRGLLEAAMVGFQEAVRNFIMNGHNLLLFPLGSFCVSLLSTEGADTPEAVSARQIKGAHLWFRSSPTLNGYKARQNIRLVRIGEEEAEGGGEEEEGAHEPGPPHGGPDAWQRHRAVLLLVLPPAGRERRQQRALLFWPDAPLRRQPLWREAAHERGDTPPPRAGAARRQGRQTMKC